MVTSRARYGANVAAAVAAGCSSDTEAVSASVALAAAAETGPLEGYATLDTEAMPGDVEADYVLDDYCSVSTPVGQLTLPHSPTIRAYRISGRQK